MATLARHRDLRSPQQRSYTRLCYRLYRDTVFILRVSEGAVSYGQASKHEDRKHINPDVHYIALAG